MNRIHTRLTSVISLLVIMVVVQFGITLPTTQVHAQVGGGVVSDPGANVQRAAINAKDAAKEVKKETEVHIDAVLAAGALGVIVNTVSFFARRLAYDTASYLASSAAGQDSQVFKEGVGQYAENLAFDTLGEAVANFSDQIGLNLCTIPNPKINAFLQVGFEGAIAPTQAPQPRCSGQQLRDSWGNAGEILEQRYGPNGSRFVAETFSASANFGESDFGVAIQGLGRLSAATELQREAALIERQIGQGFKDVKSSISQSINTPATQLREEAKALTAQSQSRDAQVQTAGLYAAADLYEVIPAAAGIFINTFAGQLLQHSLKDGLFNKEEPSSGGGAGIGEFFAANLQDNRRKAQEALSFILAPSIRQLNSYNVVKDFAACPDSPGLNNCVIESTFLQAITIAEQGEPITIQEALDQGYLHDSWPLISPRRTIDNASAGFDCYQNKYCYSNIQKLRRARILPLGFELAALRSDPDQPWTLGDVIRGFEDCNARGEADSAHPFCHLIDPHWIIKSPEAFRDTQVFGPQLLSANLGSRREECVDIKTCVYRDADGTCSDWGYCTREEKVWKLGGDVCPAEYATCRTYQDTTTGAQRNYLSRTIDPSTCDESSVGCRAYSLEQAGGSWVDPVTDLALKRDGRAQVIHLNGDLRSCSADAEGCSAVYPSQRDAFTGDFLRDTNTGQFIKDESSVAHLKLAPAYLGCYDINPGTLALEQAQTRTEAQTLNNRTQCGNFALSCAPSEVGCELFTSSEGDSLPAIVDPANVCAPECGGYETFKEEAGTFNAEAFPLYFVPSLASQCTEQYAGCEEFTNLEDTTAGGESLVYYSDLKYCEKPTATNEREFFSWEGSEQEGFVLRTHRMLQVEAAAQARISNLVPANIAAMFPVGSPAYHDETTSALTANAARCDQASYNTLLQNPFDPAAASVDCRALYDDAGNVYYRLLADTVTVSEQCQRIRKTRIELAEDTALTAAGQVACEVGFADGSQLGVWQPLTQGGTPVCQRCFNGGRYQNGTCIYQTIPAEATSCRGNTSPDEFVGCRAYTGNAGGNVNSRVLFDSFEPADSSPQALAQVLVDWTGTNLRVANEALQLSQRSLEINAATAVRTIAVDAGTGQSLKRNSFYELSLWSRGTPQNVSVTMVQNNTTVGTFTIDRATLAPAAITIGDGWQEYRLGPVQFTGASDQPVELTFTRAQAGGAALGPYYIDRLRMTRIEDRSFFIKDSWQRVENGVVYNAPPACFASNQDPSGSLPGVALGCQEYQDSSQNTYFLTQFGALCREEAVGCQPVFESHNTPSNPAAMVYDAWCDASQAQAGLCTITVATENLGECRVAVGDPGCYVDKIELPSTVPESTFPAAHIVTSTIIIPAETSTPLHVTARPEFACQSGELGCTRAGLQSQAIPGNNSFIYTYEDQFVRNDPALYEDTLCDHGQVGCAEFSDGASNVYFKDPSFIGGATCDYRSDVRVAGLTQPADGWFKQGVGICSNNSLTECRTDAQCGAGATCQNDVAVPCYPGYLDVNNEFGLWSNQSVDYNGYVGACTSEANGCIELRDKFATATDQLGEPYYRIFNDALTAGADECNGQVSLTEGCVLFDITSRPNKLYNTASSYLASNNATPRYSLVDPVSRSTHSANDANIILNVERDRQCAEWLYCSSKVLQTDDQGLRTELCSRYEACRRSDGNNCLQPVSPDPNGTFLDDQRYTSRDTSWFGLDYSGYSLLNKHQIPEYVYVSASGQSHAQYLAYEVSPLLFAQSPNGGQFDCSPPAGAPASAQNTDGQACGADFQGRCLQRKCLYPIDRTSFASLPGSGVAPVSDVVAAITAPSCKGYPEEDSPFPQTVVQGALPVPPIDQADGVTKQRTAFTQPIAKESNTEYKPGFRDVNVCQTGNPADCQCSYTKVIYGDTQTDYWPVIASSSLIADGVCVGGAKPYTGRACTVDTDCYTTRQETQTDSAGVSITIDIPVNPGVCQLKQREETHIGLDGFCLEYDLSRPIHGAADRARGDVQEYACLTWLPIQTSASGNDLYNLFEGAGYLPDANHDSPANTVTNESGGEVYCKAVDDGFLVDENFVNNIYPGGMNGLRSGVQNGNLSGARVSGVFDRNLWHFDCRENSDPGVLSGFGAWISAAVGTFSNVIGGPLASAAIGAVVGGIIDNAYTGYSPAVDGSEFYHTLCSQYIGEVGGAAEIQDQLPPGSLNANHTVFLENVRNKMYEYLLAYSWDRLGNNAVVLRAETGLINVGGDPSNTASPGLAPWRFSNGNNNNTFEINPDNGRNAVDAGVDFDATRADETARYTHDHSMNPAMPGMYSFATVDQQMNEWSFEDVYFLPLSYKGTVRGILPKTINDIHDPATDSNAFSQEILRLPLGELRRGDVVNGEFLRKRAVFIAGPDGHSDEGNEARDYRVINFSGTEAGNFINPGRRDEHMGSVNVENNHFFTWNYTIARDNDAAATINSNASANNVVPVRPAHFYDDNGGIESQTMRKYVMVFMASDNEQSYGVNGDNARWYSSQPSFLSGRQLYSDGVQRFGSEPHYPPERTTQNQTTQDPFSTNCNSGYLDANDNNQHHNPWFAVALNFADDGTFLGYTTKWCPGMNNNGTDSARLTGGINFGVVATLSNQCAEYSKVYDDGVNPLSSPTNKAWTNRTWVGAKNPDGTSRTHETINPVAGASVADVDTDIAPYGSTGLSGNLIALGNNASTPAQQSLLSYAANRPVIDGLPYACLRNIDGPTSLTRDATNYIDLSASFAPCPFALYDFTANGIPAGPYRTLRNGRSLQAVNQPSTDAMIDLQQLFAQEFANATLASTRASYTIAENVVDVSQTVNSSRTDETLVAPRIYSLDPSRCFGTQTEVCVAGEPDNITINGRNGTAKDYDGDGFPDEDSNGDRAPDPIIGRGSVVANATFFAMADDNRMPIRRVAIDWGDNRAPNQYGTVEAFNGLYKNRKPYCDSGSNGITTEDALPDRGLCLGSNDQPSNLTCMQDSDCPIELRPLGQNCETPEELAAAPYDTTLHSQAKFGNAQRACEARYLEYIHVYACSVQDANNAASLGYVQPILSLSPAYQRRIQEVLGTNTTVTNVCVFQPQVQIRDNWGYCNSAISPLAGIYGTAACDTNAAAWTRYQGAIIVIPS